jgi:hypothetical protein
MIKVSFIVKFVSMSILFFELLMNTFVCIIRS